MPVLDPETPQPLEIFCSYAHKDERFRQGLAESLGQLEQQDLIKSWYDRKIKPGEDWDRVISDKLDSADIILLLISPSFLNSPYCLGVEVQRALKRREEGVSVIPFVIRVVLWKGSPFKNLEALPTDTDGIKPVTRWRDRDQAFGQVTEAVWNIANERAKASSTSSGGKKQTSPDAHRARSFWNVPERIQLVGRGPLVERLWKTFAGAGERHVAALVGSGGLGKTSVAIEYAWRRREQYDLVVWIHSEQNEQLAVEYAAMADIIDLPSTDHIIDLPSTDLEVKKAAFRNWLQDHNRWLMIFDNAVDVDAVRACLPDPMRGHVLITSRHEIWRDLAEEISIGMLETGDAIDFLLRRTKSDDERAAKELAEMLRGLPLSLEQAAATVRATGMSLRDYVNILQATPGALQ
jgi:hypothetical protein